MRFLKTKAMTLWAYAAPFVWLCLIALIATSAARHGISNYYADKAFLVESLSFSENAISYQPRNPYAYRSKGMILFTNKDYDGAAEAFENAIKLRENDYLLWLHLGLCREKLGQFDAAVAAYERAIVLAPSYSQPKYNLGLTQFNRGRYDGAFRILSEAAANDIELYPSLLDLADTAFRNDPHAIENAVRASSYDAKKVVVGYLIGKNLMTDNIRSFLLSSELDKKDRDGFIRSLINRGDFQIAREVWLTTVNFDAADRNQLIFDGGFEKTNESDEIGFGWKIDQTASALVVRVSEKEFRSGARSLVLKFAGDVELNRRLISQLTHVLPRRKYRLTFFFRSAEMISAGPPAVVVSDAMSNKTLARSAVIQTTQAEWKESVVDFEVSDTQAVVISLQRPSCTSSPCPLFGELSLDDFSLVEIKK